MSDIVKWLRGVDHMSVEDCFLQSPLFEKAAAHIERLEAALREANVEIAAARMFGGGFYLEKVEERTREWYRNEARAALPNGGRDE